MIRSAPELLRFGINGAVATCVHYVALTIALQTMHIPSAALANFLGAAFGIASSFLGNRYFVFTNSKSTLIRQLIQFSGLYGAIAILHGVILLLWTDWKGWDYRTGFLLATFAQIFFSYMGNKYLVFKK